MDGLRADRPTAGRPWARLAAVATLGLAVALVPLLVAPTTTAASAPPPPPGFATVFSDDFNGAAGSSVNGSNWIFDTGTQYPGGAPNWGTGEVETMTSSTRNVFQDGAGNLHIKALRDGAGNWTSGRLESRRTDFQPPPGGTLRIQSSIQMPDVSGAGAMGYWPAFWSLGAPFRGVFTNWPRVGEIDIMESVNARQVNTGTMHCGFLPGGPCNEFTGLAGSIGCSCWGQRHTYTLEWDRSGPVETIRWFLDGAQYHSVSQDQLDPTTWANATQHGYFLMYDLAMGGAFPAAFGGGPTAATVSGGEMVIDYVAVYSGGRGGPTPTPTSTPTPTGGPTPTPTPTPTSGGGVPATSTIQAESFAAKSARPQTEPTADAGGGLDVGSLGDGDWMQYNDVDFGSTPLTQFNARAASGAGGGISGLVEVHLDSRSSPSIGSFAIASTGGWQSWRTVPANMAPTTGRHTVFIEFVSGSGQVFVSVNWLTFSP